MNQNQIFLSGEGDEWYKRNRLSINSRDSADSQEDVRYICQILQPFKHQIQKVFEIGCSSGFKLEAICGHFDATGIGVDPSAAAVLDGNSRIKGDGIKLIVGTSDKLPVESDSVDFVYFAFCLYLFDRNALISSLAEANRVLKSGGFIAITDFDPGKSYRRRYSHLDGLFSYKQDYSAFYTATGLFYLVGKHSFSHRCHHFELSAAERVSITVLFKETEPYQNLG